MYSVHLWCMFEYENMCMCLCVWCTSWARNYHFVIISWMIHSHYMHTAQKYKITTPLRQTKQPTKSMIQLFWSTSALIGEIYSDWLGFLERNMKFSSVRCHSIGFGGAGVNSVPSRYDWWLLSSFPIVFALLQWLFPDKWKWSIFCVVSPLAVIHLSRIVWIYIYVWRTFSSYGTISSIVQWVCVCVSVFVWVCSCIDVSMSLTLLRVFYILSSQSIYGF